MGAVKSYFSTIANLISKVKKVFKPGGASHIAYAVVRITMSYPCYLYHRYLRRSRTFTLGGKTYEYFIHPYNMTWRSERSVEVPVVRRIMAEFHGGNILEVGNVLSYYFACNHEVLDKYDKTSGVINEDIVDFQPHTKYDLIVSISTLEHVGWDEQPREHMKVLDAVDQLRDMLAPGGKIVVTFALGYNPVLDWLVNEGKIPFTKRLCLKRVSANNWKQLNCNDILCRARYGHHSSYATGLFVGIIES